LRLLDALALVGSQLPGSRPSPDLLRIRRTQLIERNYS
jgi:hypothetical protein